MCGGGERSDALQKLCCDNTPLFQNVWIIGHWVTLSLLLAKDKASPEPALSSTLGMAHST